MIHAETPEDAFTAGLLHDIGKVVLVRYFPDQFLRILLHCENEGVTFDEAENQENSYSHGSIGAYLIRKWKLPQNLEDSVRYHHCGHPKVNDSDQFQSVVLADTIVNMMNGHKNVRVDFQSIPATIQEVMRQPLLELRLWYPEAKKEIAQACELLLKER
jgi:putative nucleotidyltransferase with HDIG domain